MAIQLQRQIKISRSDLLNNWNLFEIDNIVKNLDIKKAPGINQTNNKLIKHLKPGLVNLLVTYPLIG